jgi:FKBP-type peptidyl-prolyl cis-trans isomerase
MNKTVLQFMVLLPLSVTSGCSCQKVDQPTQEQQTTHVQEANNMQDKPTRITNPSGLQYEVIEKSQNANPKKPEQGNTVTVHYTGWLEDPNGNKGKKFDSSVDRGQPFKFVIGVGQVIKGWDEGVMEMRVGEKRRLIIPANLAYGNRAIGNDIPANSTLVFEVELIDTK